MKAFRYRLPLTTSIRLGENEFADREGVLLSNKGQWSEASPLPAFSRETIDDVVHTVSRVVKQTDSHKDKYDDARVRDLDAATVQLDSSKFASLQFATDALGIRGSEQSVPINALLQGDEQEIVRKAAELADSACEAVKLKVGRRSFDADVKLVWKIRETLRPSQQLRLDANRAWDLATAVRFAERIVGCSIEYIEEPLRDPAELETMFAVCKLPYALDETLAPVDSAAQVNVDDFPNASALIVKPTILGGRATIDRLAASGKPLVFSACYESGVGIARIAQLAAHYSPGIPAGLDTYTWLAEDVLTERLKVVDWRLTVPDELCIDHSKLQEIK